MVVNTPAPSIPTLSTDIYEYGITTNSAEVGGVSISDNGASIFERGICWSTSPNPTTALTTKIYSGTGIYNFWEYLTNLTQGTVYYVRAFATNSVGTGYGNQITFSTLTPPPPTLPPTIYTNAPSTISYNSAFSGGYSINDGGSYITQKGICWDVNPNPTTALATKTYNYGGTSNFTAQMTFGIVPATTYYVRAYATNANGTSYGEEFTFTSASPNVPSISTAGISSITINQAYSGGNSISENGSSLTDKGVCWSTSPNPDISLPTKTSEGGNYWSFSSLISGLSPGTIYYVRAYATNAVGTGYGNQVTFITPGIPAVETTPITSFTQTTAIAGGNVTDMGGSNVSNKGVCYSLSPAPTINDYVVSSGTGGGAFTSSLSGLSSGTTYYVRAFVTTAAGTYYGSEEVFTTAP